MWLNSGSLTAALLAIATAPIAVTGADTRRYQDPLTGLTFSIYDAQYKLGDRLQIGVAVPANATTGSPYDVTLKIIAPKAATGWVGVSWAGTMLDNPLTAVWQYGSSAVVSPRFTRTYTAPMPYAQETLTIVPEGTRVNNTHWEVTLTCRGCTSYTRSSGQQVFIDPKGQSNRMAFAYSSTAPGSNSPSASLQHHPVNGYWNHDFSTAANADLAV